MANSNRRFGISPSFFADFVIAGADIQAIPVSPDASGSADTGFGSERVSGVSAGEGF